MFLPDNMKDKAAEKKAQAERQEAYVRIEKWALELIPANIRNGVQISVQEIQCGDPECAPIDTAVSILFNAGGRGMMGLPLEAKDVTREDLESEFPTPEVLEKWSRGEEADWPPMDDNYELPDLRFDIGQKVECRIGPDPITGWAKGTIIQLWYRESNWQPGSYAPYKIRLDDGRDIFAPGDIDQVIRAQKS